jgi:hypothetical protein
MNPMTVVSAVLTVILTTALFELADDLSLPDGGITNSHIDANGDGDIGIDTSEGETSAEESSKLSQRGQSEYGTNHLVRHPGSNKLGSSPIIQRSNLRKEYI